MKRKIYEGAMVHTIHESQTRFAVSPSRHISSLVSFPLHTPMYTCMQSRTNILATFSVAPPETAVLPSLHFL